MKLRRLSLRLLLIPFATLALATPSRAQSASNLAEPQPANALPANSMVVYVSDFDLDVVYPKPTQRPVPRRRPPVNSGNTSSSPGTAPKNTPGAYTPAALQTPPAADSPSEETPADRANALVNAMSENLIRALTQAGYDARRLPAGASLPKVGLRIRGVFAEADERNRARRLLVGGEPVGPKMLLFVGVNNLKSPEQPLYELPNPPMNDPRHGPVITVTSYAPAARFELGRDPSGEELQKIAAQIVADLTALLNANRLSLAQ
jgi:hypothetical protein